MKAFEIRAELQRLKVRNLERCVASVSMAVTRGDDLMTTLAILHANQPATFAFGHLAHRLNAIYDKRPKVVVQPFDKQAHREAALQSERGRQ